jgi:hypothetical protein
MNQTQELKKLINAIPHKDREHQKKLFILDVNGMNVSITFTRKSKNYNRIIELLENMFIPYEDWDNIGCNPNSNYIWTYYNIKITNDNFVNQLNINQDEIHNLVN